MVLAAQRLLQILIENESSTFGIVVNGYAYKWRVSRHIHYKINQGFFELMLCYFVFEVTSHRLFSTKA